MYGDQILVSFTLINQLIYVWNSPGPGPIGKHPGPVDNKILFFRNKIKLVRFDQKHPEK